MSLFYLPGCKFTKYDPKASNKLVSFCKSYLDTQVLGCCSKDFNMPKPGDTVLYVCPTCALIMKESNPGATLKSIYEAIFEYDEPLCSSDNTYNTQNKTCIQWVDLQKKEITIQDCWRSREDPALQLAIRKVLIKMNATITELDNKFDKADYCGLSLLKEPSPRYEWLARSFKIRYSSHIASKNKSNYLAIMRSNTQLLPQDATALAALKALNE